MGEPPKKSHPDFNLRSAYRYLGGEDPSVQMKRGDDEFREGKLLKYQDTVLCITMQC